MTKPNKSQKKLHYYYFYLFGIALIGVFAIIKVFDFPFPSIHPRDLVFFTFFTLIFSLFEVVLPSGMYMNLHFPVMSAVLLLFGPQATIISFIPALIAGGIRRKTPIRIPFNIGQNAISLLIASWVFSVGDGIPHQFNLIEHLPLALGIIFVYDFISVSLVCIAITLLKGGNLFQSFLSNFFLERLKIIPLFYTNGIILALVFQHEGILGGILISLPLLSIYLILRDQKIIFQTKETAFKDPLTSLFNRRFMDQWLNKNLPKAISKGSDLTLLMLDIDDFKKVNDRYGHEVGDKILIQVSRTIRETLRDCDVVVRYGGEEFVILLPDIDLNTGYRIAERVRKQIEEIVPFEEKNPSENIKASLGITSLQNQTEEKVSPETLLRQADKAIYLAKHEGKNRVYSYFPVNN